MKKLALKKLILPVDRSKFSELPTVYNSGLTLYYSGFSLTDNINFVEFYLHRPPKLNFPFVKFDFQEKQLTYELGPRVVVSVDEYNVHFNNMAIDRMYYDHFVKRYKFIDFKLLKTFLGRRLSNAVAVLDLVKDNLIGVLMAK